MSDPLSPEKNAEFLAANKEKPGVVVRPSGLQYRVIAQGHGKQPQAASMVTVHYRGTLINGKEFDSSLGGAPARFPANRLIKGWVEALQLMHEGDKWELVIPSDLAYGTRGAPPDIGANQTLVFEIELLKVE